MISVLDRFPQLRRPTRWLRGRLPVAAGMMDSRRAATFLLLAFFLASSIWTIRHLHIVYIDEAQVDENVTVWLGVKYLNPLDGTHIRWSVGETTRWFARLLWPVGLYHMGGNAAGLGTKTEMLRFVADYKSRPLKEAISSDTRIQDLVFAMRAAFGLLAIGSFCLALWVLFRRLNLAAALAYAALALGNPLVREQLFLFYSETSMFILFNLAVFLCSRQRPPTYRHLAYLGILAAAAMSTKLSGALIAAPLFLYAAFTMGDRDKPRIEVFLLFFLAFMFLINIGANSLEDLVAQMLYPVMHFNSGHDGVTGAGWRTNLQFILRDSGYVVIPLFLASLLWLARRPRARLMPLYALGLGIVAFLWSFTHVAWYVDRNMASVYVAMSFIIALAVGDLAGKTLADRPALQAGALLGLLLVFAATGARLVSDLPPTAGNALLNENKKRLQNCGAVGAIGVTDDVLQSLRAKIQRHVVQLPEIRGPFTHKERPVPYYIRYRLSLESPVPSFPGQARKYLPYDCLVVHRKRRIKHVTGYFAPQHYQLHDRAGNLFFFVKPPEKKG